MPRTCTVCTHPDRAGIDRALLAGEPYRIIAKRYGASPAAVNRHKDHLPAQLARAQDAAQIADADDLLRQMQELRNTAVSILEKAERAGDYRTALMGIREARGCVETLMEVEGELDRRGVVNVVVNPEWIEIRTILLATLTPYPEAAQAVAGRLQMIEGGADHAAD